MTELKEAPLLNLVQRSPHLQKPLLGLASMITKGYDHQALHVTFVTSLRSLGVTCA